MDWCWVEERVKITLKIGGGNRPSISFQLKEKLSPGHGLVVNAGSTLSVCPEEETEIPFLFPGMPVSLIVGVEGKAFCWTIGLLDIPGGGKGYKVAPLLM